MKGCSDQVVKRPAERNLILQLSVAIRTPKVDRNDVAASTEGSIGKPRSRLPSDAFRGAISLLNLIMTALVHINQLAMPEKERESSYQEEPIVIRICRSNSPRSQAERN